MTPDQIKAGHTYEMDDEFSRTVVSTHGGELTYRDCYGVSECSVAYFARHAVRDITPAPESGQGEKVAQAQSQAASRGDGGRTPLTDLSTIAANLITCQGLPDPDEPYRPLGKRWMREHRQRSVRMGNAIAAAVAQLRKAQKAATPPAADAVKGDLLAALHGLLNALPSATTHPAIKAARAAIARAEAAE